MARHAVKQSTMHACEAIGCADFAPAEHLFCERHDAMLQSDIKTILAKLWRPKGKQTHVFNVTLERAKEEILFCQTAGYRVPRPAEFEW